MSQWAPESKKGTQDSKPPGRVLGWMGIAPFFLSAFFFLSTFLVVFSPLPILLSSMIKGRRWAWAAILINCALVGGIGGSLSLMFFLVFVVCLSLVLPEMLRLKKSLEKTVGVTFLSMMVLGLLLGALYSGYHHLNLIYAFRAQIDTFVDYLSQSVSSGSNAWVPPAELEEWKKNLVIELPSALAIFSLSLVWINLMLVLRVNPSGLRQSLGLETDFFRKWKAPQFLVWPTLCAGFFLVVEVGMVTPIALNVFKFLMAIYAIQGLSILSYFFDLWKIQGIFRMIGFSLFLLVMMPMVLSLGFFDLWFDFRAKFRQS